MNWSGVRVPPNPLEFISIYKLIEGKSLLYPYEVYHTYSICFSGGTVDTADLESAALKSVEVQIFSGALDNQTKIVYDCHMRNIETTTTPLCFSPAELVQW